MTGKAMVAAARRAAIKLGHDMEPVQDDAVQHGYVSACLDCGQVVAVDPDEDPALYGTAMNRSCRRYEPAPRRDPMDMDLKLTRIEDEPIERHIPVMLESKLNGKTRKRKDNPYPADHPWRRWQRQPKVDQRDWNDLEAIA